MKVKDIREHFLSRATWVNPEKKIDQIIAGDPDKEVSHCWVTWMPSFRVLRLMAERKIPLLICHEPTFWNHRNEEIEKDRTGKEKQQFIADHDLIIFRNHDCWDRWPEIGIPWAWARFLGLGPIPAGIGGNGYQHRYDIKPVLLDELAEKIASRCRPLGEPFVQVTGEGSRRVSRIGIGTGCGCNIQTFVEMGCDCSVVCDDGTCYWAGIQWADDMNHAVIRVNHGTSEEPGMITLTEYINRTLKGLRAEHLPHGSTFRLVGGNTP